MCIRDSSKNIEREYREHLEYIRKMEKVKPEEVKDESATKIFSLYEEQMNLRHVHLADFENRLKRFVFLKGGNQAEPNITITLRQLQESFKGNKHLEAILEDKTSLDWRMLMAGDLFLMHNDEDDEVRDQESIEEDPTLQFRVAELNLLGLMYCKCDATYRIKSFFDFFQPGLEDQISCNDRDLEVFIPLMGRICYTTIIDLFNEEHEHHGTSQARFDLIPKNLQLL